MGCMENALSNLFPTGWLDPYGSMPLNDSYSVQIDITQVETDDGIKVTAVKTPPRAGTTSIQDAINMALGMGCCEIEAPTNSPQSADQGKRDDKKPDDNEGKSGKMDHASPPGRDDRDRDPGSTGDEPEDEKDEKEKAPGKR